MTTIFNCSNLVEMRAAAEKINQNLTHPLILLQGEMGSGKTTLVQMIISAMGVDTPVDSPTFSIINEYIDSRKNPIYHLDLYRLNSFKDLIEIGVEDYFDSHYSCFVEWPELAMPLLPNGYHTIQITVEQGNRIIKFE